MQRPENFPHESTPFPDKVKQVLEQQRFYESVQEFQAAGSQMTLATTIVRKVDGTTLEKQIVRENGKVIEWRYHQRNADYALDGITYIERKKYPGHKKFPHSFVQAFFYVNDEIYSNDCFVDALKQDLHILHDNLFRQTKFHALKNG